jgi:hypothetical protein
MKNQFCNPGLALALFIVCGTGFAQQTQMVALRDFNSNNTSASSAASGSSGDASNFSFGAVSKVPIRSLLGASGIPIYAHLMPWFGSRGHINVGYDSAKPDQVRRQVEDMVSRGIDGAIVYWTGSSGGGNSARTNDVAMKLMKEAERHPGFQFAIQEDKQALEECAKRSCDITAAVTADLQYVAKVFFNSPAYITMNGRPVLFFFGLEAYKNGINWDRIRASVPGTPLFVFRNSVGFDYAQSDGAFAWNAIDKLDPNDIGLKYLDHFYRVAGQHGGAVSIGSVYAGFNDRLASWSKGRIINSSCGDTWLKTFNVARQYLDNFAAMQLLTWNDYEEGSQIEPGIDNCVSIQASAADDHLRWTIQGSPNTIHHFAVWVSSDNRSFRLVKELPANARNIGFADTGLNPGQYSFVVQAVGQPSMLNHNTDPISATLP